MKSLHVALVLTVGALGTATTGSLLANEPGFRRDVMPVLFRAGCNSGTCHGSARGKDGFRLSLFGFDPRGDYFRITQEIIGRRVNLAVPDQSLLLKKAIGAVPHTGGKSFDRESEYYATLLRWIEAGAPDDDGKVPEVVSIKLSQNRVLFNGTGETVELRVTALSDDGNRRDVTSLARFHSNNTGVASIDENGAVEAHGHGDTHVFARFNRFTIGAEVIVLPPAEDFTWPDPPRENFLDELVFDRLEKLRIAPSELCDDETFLRRVTLDLSGLPPTVEEYRAFLRDRSKDKRSRKIDELLAKDSFADLWTSIWAEQLRIIGGNYAPIGTHIKAADAFYEWIRRELRNDRPLNEFVSEMVSASGSNLINGPANLYTMLLHSPRFEPKAFAADFSQVFLGVQIQCAECHDHPFDRWTMDDYYGFVSFFQGVKRKRGVEPRERRIYYDTSAVPAKHLVDQRPMPARALGAARPVEHDGDPRPHLARWLTSPKNELFSRNLANRVWAQLLGRGIVEPVDDVRISNPPSNGPLLDALSERLVESGFQLRSLVRDICHSRVYQLSSKPTPSNRRDERQFSHAKLRRLRADVLLDSVVAVTGVPRRFSGFPEGTRAIDVYPRVSGDTKGPHFGDEFFKTFGRSGRSTICACETKSEPTLSQALHLSVGDTVSPRVASQSSKLKALESADLGTKHVIEELFILTLGRKPTTEELTALSELIESAEIKDSAYEDVFWGLLNSTEFSFNR